MGNVRIMSAQLPIEDPTLIMETNRVEKSKIIAVEGKDEINFFFALLEHMSATDYEIREVGGESNFQYKLPALINMSGFFDNVKYLAIIRDADKNSAAKFESISGIIRDLGLVPPKKVNEFSDGQIKVGIFIMPGNYDNGMLEDLCLQTVSSDPAMEYVLEFEQKVQLLKECPKCMAKAKAQVFLATRKDIVNSVGLGAIRNYWDFRSENLNDLKNFINLIENSKEVGCQ